MDDLKNLKKEYVEEVDIRNITEEEYKELFNYILNSYEGFILTIRIDDSEALTLSSPLLLSYQKQRDAEVKGLKEQHTEEIKHIESEVTKIFNNMSQFIARQEEKIKDKEEKIKDKDIKAIEQGRTIAEQGRKAKEQEKRIKQLEQVLKQVRLERDNLDAAYTGYIVEIEDKLKAAEEEIKTLKDRIDTAPSGDSVVRCGNGKASELTTKQIQDVVRLWCLGGSINSVSKKSGASWGQVSRLVKGQLTNKSSKKKILKAVNHLLKVNQNKEFIDKLNIIKTMYS